MNFIKLMLFYESILVAYTPVPGSLPAYLSSLQSWFKGLLTHFSHKVGLSALRSSTNRNDQAII